MDIMQQSKQLRLYFEETLDTPLSSSSEMSIAADYSQRLTEQVQLWRSSKVSLHENDNKLCQMSHHCIR